MKHPPTNRNAFTLVELLVVVTIIGLLVAILLPSLQKSRELGRRVVCMANLKQTSLGCFNYVSDFKGWTPWSPRRNTFSPTHLQFGSRNLAHSANKNLTNPANPDYYFPDEKGPDVVGKAMEGGYLPINPKYLYCPSRTSPDRYSIGYSSSWSWANWATYSTTEFSYMYRLHRRMDEYGNNAVTPDDVYGADLAIWDTGSSGSNISYGAPMCHQDGYYNAVFYDGSVRAVIDKSRIFEVYSSQWYNREGGALTTIDALSKQ
ncbi:MAG: DUF1559 domain-containing protein [Phycisphaera sp.]|nr:DUF1559 domain-containing protein [Phycisphaera sp.]